MGYKSNSELEANERPMGSTWQLLRFLPYYCSPSPYTPMQSTLLRFIVVDPVAVRYIPMPYTPLHFYGITIH